MCVCVCVRVCGLAVHVHVSNFLVWFQRANIQTSFHFVKDCPTRGLLLQVSVLAGSGYGQFNDGKKIEASFNSPYGIAIDSSDNVYVADTSNHRLRKVS